MFEQGQYSASTRYCNQILQEDPQSQIMADIGDFLVVYLDSTGRKTIEI